MDDPGYYTDAAESGFEPGSEKGQVNDHMYMYVYIGDDSEAEQRLGNRNDLKIQQAQYVA